MAQKVAKEIGQAVSLIDRVIDAIYQRILDGDTAPGSGNVLAACHEKIGKWVFAVQGDQSIAQRIVGSM